MADLIGDVEQLGNAAVGLARSVGVAGGVQVCLLVRLTDKRVELGLIQARDGGQAGEHAAERIGNGERGALCLLHHAAGGREGAAGCRLRAVDPLVAIERDERRCFASFFDVGLEREGSVDGRCRGVVVPRDLAAGDEHECVRLRQIERSGGGVGKNGDRVVVLAGEARGCARRIDRPGCARGCAERVRNSGDGDADDVAAVGEDGCGAGGAAEEHFGIASGNPAIGEGHAVAHRDFERAGGVGEACGDGPVAGGGEAAVGRVEALDGEPERDACAAEIEVVVAAADGGRGDIADAHSVGAGASGERMGVHVLAPAIAGVARVDEARPPFIRGNRTGKAGGEAGLAGCAVAVGRDRVAGRDAVVIAAGTSGRDRLSERKRRRESERDQANGATHL